MKRRLPIVVFASFVLAACQPSTDSGRIVGQLESDRVELAAEFAEPIVERFIVEGQRVNAGDPLIRQNAERAAAKAQEIEALLLQTRARLSELTRGPREEQIEAAQANVDGAVKDLQFRRIEYERAQSLLDQELASPDVRDRAKAALDGAGANLDFTKARLSELLTGTTVEELDQARASVQQMEAQLQRARVDLMRHTTTAPVDGVIDSLLFEPGERPQPGQPLAILLSGQQPYARVFVPERMRVRVAAGTNARIHVDGLDEPVMGTVRWVASEAAFTPYFALTEHDRGRLTYAAKIDIDAGGLRSGNRLPDGVPVEVEIVTD